MGTYRALGEVVEDRGNIGVGGRRLLRIRTDVHDDAEPVWIELPEDEIAVLPRNGSAATAWKPRRGGSSQR